MPHVPSAIAKRLTRRAPTRGWWLCAVGFVAMIGAALAPASAQSATFARRDYPLLGNNHVAADLNGDGRIDLAGTGNTVVSVMLGNGDGSFQPKVDLPLATWTQDLSAADFNGDGRRDLAVTLNDPAVSVAILLGNGNGTFGAPRYIANTSGADSPAILATDLDNDGRQDLVLTHSLAAFQAPIVLASTISVLTGNGDGTFQLAREITVGTGMLNLAAADFDRNGTKDLVVAGDTGRCHVLLGRGDGTFTQQTITLVTQNPFGVDATDVGAADLDADGAVDAVVVIGLQGSRTAILMGNGNGTFRAPTFLTESQLLVPQYQAIADYNRDGKPDIALALGDGTFGLADLRLGTGNGTFQAPAMYFVPPPKASIGGGVLVSADFNNDGKPDLALQIVGASPGLAVMVNTTGGATSTPVTVASLVITPTTVSGGTSATATVTLSSAVSAATTVALSSSSALAVPPAGVTVAAGQSSATFVLATRSTATAVTATITATLNAAARSASVTIRPPAADTVSVTRAEYERQKRTLRLEATSTSSSATLQAYQTSTGALIGTLPSRGGGKYGGTFLLATNPAHVTVKSSLGGRASRSVTLE